MVLVVARDPLPGSSPREVGVNLHSKAEASSSFTFGEISCPEDALRAPDVPQCHRLVLDRVCVRVSGDWATSVAWKPVKTSKSVTTVRRSAAAAHIDCSGLKHSLALGESPPLLRAPGPRPKQRARV